jgi:hypothetical protein
MVEFSRGQIPTLTGVVIPHRSFLTPLLGALRLAAKRRAWNAANYRRNRKRILAKKRSARRARKGRALRA